MILLEGEGERASEFRTKLEKSMDGGASEKSPRAGTRPAPTPRKFWKNRIKRPEDVVQLALFLAAQPDKAEGQIIFLNGISFGVIEYKLGAIR